MNFHQATSFQYPLRPGEYRVLDYPVESLLTASFRRICGVYVVSVSCERQVCKDQHDLVTDFPSRQLATHSI